MSVTSTDVTAVVQGVLRRAPTSQEITDFGVFPDKPTLISYLVTNTTLTNEDITENRECVRPIIRLYSGIFQRKPDSAGLTFWVGAYRSYAASNGGYSQANEVAACADMFNSTEYQNDYPSTLTNTQYVTDVYTNIFHRAPDAAGLAFWVGQLNNGYSRLAMIVQFTESTEYLSDTDTPINTFQTACANDDPNAYTGIIF